MQKEMPDLEVIYIYTRAEAIEDKVLIDVSELASEVGFECPVAITSAVYADCVAWLEGETEQNRLRDVLNALRLAALGSRGHDSTLFFAVWRIPLEGQVPEHVRLKSLLGFGDNEEWVMTIMLPLED
jgi:hypothetical protein